MVKHKINQTAAMRMQLLEIIGFYIRFNGKAVTIKNEAGCYFAPFFEDFLKRYGIRNEFMDSGDIK